MTRKEIQDFILNEWKKSGKSKYSFAQDAGCTPEAIGHWQRGNRLMTYEQAEMIAKNLGLKFEVMIGK